jgi:hypothetical protein
MLDQQRRPAPPASGVRSVDVIVVRLREGEQEYVFGVLLSQVQTLLRRVAATLRTGGPAGSRAPVAEVRHEGAWLPVYDLAQSLGLLSPWKMGVHTAVRNYLLVVRGARPLALAVDEVAEIGYCPLDQVLPLPGWLRRQLAPNLVWGGVDPRALAYTRATLDESMAAGVERLARGPALLLLLDCFALKCDNP